MYKSAITITDGEEVFLTIGLNGASTSIDNGFYPSSDYGLSPDSFVIARKLPTTGSLVETNAGRLDIITAPSNGYWADITVVGTPICLLYLKLLGFYWDRKAGSQAYPD
jgi:hypothetical protein